MGPRKVFGPVVVVTAAFRRDLQAWLSEPGPDGEKRSQRKLAVVLGCNPSMISQLLNDPDNIKTSTLVVPIVQHTGIPMPTDAAPQDSDALMLEQLRRLRELHPASFEAVIALIHARLAGK